MLRREDVETIIAPEVIFEIAKSLDPLAFDNNDMQDSGRRRVLVYTRIEAAYRAYLEREAGRRASGCDLIVPNIEDADVPW
jgi:hypothetical protein